MCSPKVVFSDFVTDEEALEAFLKLPIDEIFSNMVHDVPKRMVTVTVKHSAFIYKRSLNNNRGGAREFWVINIRNIYDRLNEFFEANPAEPDRISVYQQNKVENIDMIALADHYSSHKRSVLTRVRRFRPFQKGYKKVYDGGFGLKLHAGYGHGACRFRR